MKYSMGTNQMLFNEDDRLNLDGYAECDTLIRATNAQDIR